MERREIFCGYKASFMIFERIDIELFTGYMTTKGELIRAILFPKPAEFQFYKDILKCALLVGIFGVAGTIYSTYAWIMNQVSLHLSTSSESYHFSFHSINQITL